MGILDVIKRWFGGGKSAPVKTSQPTRTPDAVPTAPIAKPAEPALLSAAEALDVIAANRAAAKPAGQSDRREKPRVNARDGTRVLVIDDSPTIVALLKRMLEQNGYRTSEAVDAETGVTMATSDPPDLIFLDIVLPGMNGFEALRRLRRDPATKVVPIVMISGNELATEQFYAQRIGADDFMKKPFSRSEVFARIEKLLDAEKVPRRMVKAGAAAAATVTPLPASNLAASPASPAATPAAVVEPIAATPAEEPTPIAVAASAPEPTPDVVAPPIVAAAPEAPLQASAVPVAVEAVVYVAVPDAQEIAAPIFDSAPEVPAEPAMAATESTAADEVEVAHAATDPAVASDAAPEESSATETSTVADSDAATAVTPAPDDEKAKNGASLTPSEAPVEAVADSKAFRTPDTAQTLIIEETLRAPANDAHDADPLPLAAVASRVTASPMMSDGPSAVAIGAGASPVSSVSSSQIISS